MRAHRACRRHGSQDTNCPAQAHEMGRPISLVRRGYGWVVPMYQTHHANLPGGIDCDEYPREFRASAASDAGTEKSRAPALASLRARDANCPLHGCKPLQTLLLYAKCWFIHCHGIKKGEWGSRP